MDLKECYAALGGDYEGVLGRLRSERLVRKFAVKFLADGSYALLCESIKNGQIEEAFRASHTIKGVCQNLGFDRLYRSSEALTEVLRDASALPPETEGLLAQVTSDYEVTVAAIRTLEAGG